MERFGDAETANNNEGDQQPQNAREANNDVDGAQNNESATQSGVLAPELKNTKKAASNRRKSIVVDEPEEKWIQVQHSTVVFRPGEVLRDPHKIRLAEHYGILTRER